MTTLIEKIKPASLENYELKNLISKRKQKKGRVLTNDLLQKCSRRLPYSCEKRPTGRFAEEMRLIIAENQHQLLFVVNLLHLF